jgi:predicted Holliday junction resolvase-like endonuclease
MTTLEKTIIQEIATLPEYRLPSLLAYVRFLKDETESNKQEIEERFEKSWERVRARAKELNITEEDIEAEIRAVREGR